MGSRRETLLSALAEWRRENLLDDATAARLRAHVEASPDDARDDGGERGSFAVGAMQIVGGILLGAALVALVVFLKLEGDAAGWTLLFLGAIGVGAGAAFHLATKGRDGLAEALLAAGLVPLGAAGGPAEQRLAIGLVAAALAAGVVVLRRGRGPTVVLAGAAFAVAAFMASNIGIFDAGTPLLWWGLLLAFFALLLVFRRESWTMVALGLFVLPLTVAFIMVLNTWGVESSHALELLVGGYLGILLIGGILLNNRGLVAGAAAGLTIDAVIFANDLGGPGTAVIVLLALGGVLVWQAEFLRAYFKRDPPMQPL